MCVRVCRRTPLMLTFHCFARVAQIGDLAFKWSENISPLIEMSLPRTTVVIRVRAQHLRPTTQSMVVHVMHAAASKGHGCGGHAPSSRAFVNVRCRSPFPRGATPVVWMWTSTWTLWRCIFLVVVCTPSRSSPWTC